MEKRWTLKQEVEETAVKRLSASLNGLNHTLSKVLLQRGIDTFQKAKAFFRPSIEELHDPFLMKDMSQAVERLQLAIDKNEKILIYGDYDVDGTTSVALVYSFLNAHYPNLDFYIPDRYQEGYGISFQGVDYASDNEISLVIALDCGIKAIDKVAYAKKKNIDFIICDHHNPGEELPPAVAVLDPKRSDCTYPFKELSGCGVGFKLMQAFAQKSNIPISELEDKLDILAVSICADIVPIVGENRVFTFYGLKKLNTNPQPGFKAMLEIANVKKKELTVTDVVFTLAPRINAAGRIESGNKAVEVMLAENTQQAYSGGNHINEHNTNRKELDSGITEEAIQMIRSDENLLNQKTTVLYQEHWHKGVIGIVASRCIENFYRPTIILTESNGKAAGSARSVKGFDVYKALDQCSDLLEQFGGHKYAAGMTMPIENIEAFQARFEEVVSKTIPEHLLQPEIEIDAEIKLHEIEAKFYQVLKQFAPFGPQNMKPVFVARNLKERGYGRLLKEKHLKLDLLDPKNPGVFYPAIGFNMADKYSIIKSENPFDVAFTVEENEWNGKVSLQLNIKDVKASI